MDNTIDLESYSANLVEYMNSRYGRICPTYQWWYKKTYAHQPPGYKPSVGQLKELLALMDRYTMAEENVARRWSVR